MGGYALGVTTSVFGPIVYFFAELIFIGMMELANQISNPFGSDEVDFPVDDWLAEMMASAALLVECDYSPVIDAWIAAGSPEKPLKAPEIRRTRLHICGETSDIDSYRRQS